MQKHCSVRWTGLTASVDKSLAKNRTTVSETQPLSTSFSFHEARLTQAQATVEGKNAENLQSEIETNVIYFKSEETLSSR